MNWEVIGATGEWAGAVAVVVTLVYLARQLRASNDATATAAENALITDYNRLLEHMYSDPNLCDLVLRSSRDFHNLSTVEKLQVHTFLTSQIFTVQNMYFQRKRGQLDPAIVDPLIASITAILKNPGNLEWWADAKNVLDPEYVAYVEEQHKLASVQPFIDTFPWMSQE
ncbi:MAG: hypothetical protein GKR90_17570 [Pseudomonadales bacterium]|nr:hypothetical protein [Pseudomonadales bacterium]